MRKIFISLFIIFTLYLPGNTQSIYSGSPGGIGLRQYITSVRGMGMGHTGLAIKDSISLNAYNSASWRHIPNTKINIAMRYEYIKTDLEFQDFQSSTANFSGLQLAVPIQQDHWVFGLSLTPYSRTNFAYSLSFKNRDPEYDSNVFYEGNITRSQIALAWSGKDWFGIGVNLNYFFGTIKDEYFLFFQNPNIADSFYELEYQFQGPGLGFSFDLDIGQKFRFGGFLDLQTTLNYDVITNSPITFEEQKFSSKATLPWLWGIGGSLLLSPQWNFTADFALQDWSEGLEIDGRTNNSLERWYRLGAGLEHSRSQKKSSSLFNKIDLRAGISYGALGLISQGNSLNEYVGHLGFGIPFYDSKARLDVALMGGIRGNLGDNLAEETFFKALLSVSFGELWFQNIR